ncbi:MAG: ROK family protein [Elusimicrobiales bacterium]
MIGIGIDAGGTFVKIAAVDEEGNIREETQIASAPEQGVETFVRNISAVVSAWRKKLGREKMCAGIGIAGDVDPEKGVVRYSPNLNKWREVQIAKPMSEATGLPCVLENDATVAAWGAYDYELKRKYNTVLAVTMGTGIGGGLVLDGKLYHGATGSAGEIGHVNVVYEGELCNCGDRGCVEAYAGHYGIMRRAAQILPRLPDTSLLKKMAQSEKVSGDLLCRAADQGDEDALRIWKETGLYLGRALADVCLIINPDAIVLAGGVSRAHAHFLPGMAEAFSQRRIDTPFRHVKIIPARSPNLGSIGAAMFALQWRKAKK